MCKLHRPLPFELWGILASRLLTLMKSHMGASPVATVGTQGQFRDMEGELTPVTYTMFPNGPEEDYPGPCCHRVHSDLVFSCRVGKWAV